MKIYELIILLVYNKFIYQLIKKIIGDDISIKSANVKLNIKDVCNLISVSSEHFN